MASLSASLGWTAGKRTARSSGLPFASGQMEKKLNGGNSALDILAELRQRREQRLGGSSSNMDVSRMMDPHPSSADALPADLMFQTAEETMIHKTKRAPLKLGPSTGRSITIGATGIDVGRGFRLLEQACARNKIKSDANKQRFHERGGLKRKRLRRERWRRKFMDGFKATVGRVKQLKHQGW